MNEDEQKRIIEELSRHKLGSQELQEYSIKRIDTLLVIISGAGIYASLEALKFITEHPNLKIETLLLKLAGLAFVVAIGLNFISQWLGWLAHKKEERWAEDEIRRVMNFTISPKKKVLLAENEQSKTSKTITILNIASTVFMMGGLTMLVVYFLINF